MFIGTASVMHLMCPSQSSMLRNKHDTHSNQKVGLDPSMLHGVPDRLVDDKDGPKFSLKPTHPAFLANCIGCRALFASS